MRTQPGLSVIAPADAEQTAAALRETWQVPGSVYYRLGKNDTTRVPGLQGQFSFGRLAVLSQGSDVAVIAVGSISGEGAQATEMLQAQGIRTTFAVLSTLSPPPVEDLTNLLRGIPLVLTVEAHYVTGGLGSLVAEVIAEAGMSCRLVRCGVGDTTDGVSGSESFMNHRHGLSAACISERVLAELAPPVST
jgi:transketolase